MASQELIAHHWDLYKDVNGIRPRWVNYDLMSDEDLESDIESLYSQLEAEAEWESHQAELDAEAERVSHLYNSEPLPYEEYYS